MLVAIRYSPEAPFILTLVLILLLFFTFGLLAR